LSLNNLHAKRYAQAIFQIAIENNCLDRFIGDLEQIEYIFKDIEILSVLDNPKYPFEIKNNLLSDKLSGLERNIFNLLLILLTKNRISMLKDIKIEYENLLNEHRGIVEAKIVSAVPIDEDQLDRIKTVIAFITGKQILPSFYVDKRIIGGIVVRAGGKLLDGSSVSRLNQLKNRIIGLS
jgi:F-type H+-transporting ATPase subunit delta